MNTKLLYSLLAIESESHDSTAMENFILVYARRRRWDIATDALGNIYLTKGKAAVYPCIVAHMDTVHAITGEPIVPVTINGKVTGMYASNMRQTGIGGDDKCGIYAALEIMGKLPACKVALFVDEEVGCLGSSDCDMSFFNDCAFVLQADRRSASDFVTSIGGRPLASAEWLEAIAPLLKGSGYTHCAGAMTDVQALRDNGIGICCANLSAGYYRPHEDSEYIILEDLDRVTQLMLAICRTHGHQRWAFVPPAKVAPRVQAWQGGYTMQGGQWQRSAPEPVASNSRPAGMPRSIWRDLREEAAYREERERRLAEAWPMEPDDDWHNK
jgi:putative aminopeptidase FrvX